MMNICMCPIPKPNGCRDCDITVNDLRVGNVEFSNNVAPEPDPNFLREIADGLYERANELEEEQKIDPPVEEGDIIFSTELGRLPRYVIAVYPNSNEAKVRWKDTFTETVTFDDIRDHWIVAEDEDFVGEELVDHLFQTVRSFYRDLYPDFDS